METAVSWELASKSKSGIPDPIAKLFRDSGHGDPVLLFAIAEHKVDLPGGDAASQCDVWALVQTPGGMLSLSVEAKAKEAFGDEVLEKWLAAGKTQASNKNRKDRWDFIHSYLPKGESFLRVHYQMLHRCAASVIEAKRLQLQYAAFVVQAFNTPDQSFEDYALFCQALKIPAKRGTMATASVDGISLSIGWADCPLATDEQLAAIV